MGVDFDVEVYVERLLFAPCLLCDLASADTNTFLTAPLFLSFLNMPTTQHSALPVNLSILLCVLLFMQQPLGTDLYLPAMPSIGADFGISVAQVSHTMTAFLMGFTIAQLIAGPIADRWGRRATALWGTAIYVLASLACALAPGFESLLVARFFQAAGACVSFVVARAVMRDCFAAQEGVWVLSKVNSYMSLAPIIGIFAGGFLVTHGGWRYNFAVLAVFGAVVWWVLFFKQKETLAPVNVQRINFSNLWRSYRLILGNAQFNSYTASAFMGCAGLFCHLSASSIVYSRVLNASPMLYSACFAFGCCGYLCGTFLLRRWMPQAGVGMQGMVQRAGMVQIAAMTASLAIAASGFVHWSAVAACNFVFLSGYGMLMSACQAGAISAFPERAGTASSLMGAIQISGGVLAGWWMGVAFNGTVYPMLGTQLLFACAVLILGLTAVRRLG